MHLLCTDYHRRCNQQSQWSLNLANLKNASQMDADDQQGSDVKIVVYVYVLNIKYKPFYAASAMNNFSHDNKLQI